METSKAIRTRRSVRKFTQQPVEFDKLAKIIEAGTFAPSAGNIQNWRFILVTDKPVLRELYNHCMNQEVVYNAQAAIIVVGVIDKAERLYGLRGKRLYTVQNCACAVENMLLTAHDQGLGACWIGAFNEDKLSVIFSIPDKARPQAIIALGYPAEKPNFERKDLESVTYFNQYGMKIKNFHLLIRDYSVEWERQSEKIEVESDKGVGLLRKHLMNLHEKLKNHPKTKSLFKQRGAKELKVEKK